MDRILNAFFQRAQSVQLTEQERAGVKAYLCSNLSSPVRNDGRLRHTKMMRSPDTFLGVVRNSRHLSDHEKEEVRDTLVAHMRANPLHDVSNEDVEFEDAPKTHFSWTTFRLFPTLAFSLLLVFSGTVGVYAMESALPGDFVYPMKVHVSEEVYAALTLKKESRARWNARRVERRLLELETLAVRGELSPELTEAVSRHMRTHMEKTAADVQQLEQTDSWSAALELSADLEASLEAHQVALSTIAEQGQRNIGEIRMFLAFLRSNTATATGLRMNVLAAKRSAESDAELKAALGDNIRVFREHIDLVHVVLADAPEDTKVRNPNAQERLRNAEKQLEQATEELENGDDTQVLHLTREALRSADEVQLFHKLGLNERTREEVRSSDTSTKRDALSDPMFRNAAAAVGTLRKSVTASGEASFQPGRAALEKAETLLVESEQLLQEEKSDEAEARMQQALGTAQEALEVLKQEAAHKAEKKDTVPEAPVDGTEGDDALLQ